MCKQIVLSKRKNSMVRYYPESETYSLSYNNLIMNFDSNGFEDFKSNLAACYESCVSSSCCNDCNHVRDITFNTKLDGLQFLFSTAEVGELLSLMQEAQLTEMLVEK